jgi:hypothetical protein
VHNFSSYKRGGVRQKKLKTPRLFSPVIPWRRATQIVKSPNDMTCTSIHTVKKGSGFHTPSRDVTYQTLPGREIL